MSQDHIWDGAVVLGKEDINDFNEQGILPVPEETETEIRQWLHATPYNAQNGEYHKHRLSHLAGTGDWLFNSEPFATWYESEDKGILWIKGIPGSGKSVMAATLIERLSKENVPVLYFFFRQIIDANHAPHALLRDWLDQILSYSPPLQSKIAAQYIALNRELSSVSMASFWKDLKMALMSLPRVYCVVDALDEMDEDNDDFLVALTELAQWRPSDIKIAVTSRPVIRLERPLRPAPMIQIRLEERWVDIDIATYVNHRLQLCGSAIPESQHQVIRQAVPGKANGLFLYAKLAMDSFLKEGTDVKQALSNLPADLNVMYIDLLREHGMRSGIAHNLQVLILSFVTHATRPLRLLEVAEMINVTQKMPLNGDLKAIKQLVRAACGPLLEILADETICVIHHTLTEFLNGSTREKESGQTGSFTILDLGSTNIRLAESCISYLLQCLESPLMANYQGDYLDSESLDGQGKRALPANSELRSEFPFLQYSLENWHVHVRRADQHTPLSEELFQQLDQLVTEDLLNLMERLCNRYAHQNSLIFKVAGLGLTQYMTKLIQERGMSYDEFDEKVNPPMVAAVGAGHASTVKQLLAFGARAEFPIRPNGHTPLHRAALYNHGEVVQLLLEAGADPLSPKTDEDPGCYPPSSKGQTPLMYATLYGLESATKAFVSSLKDVTTVNKGLAWAAASGNPAVVQAMLTHPLADLNAVVEGNTPLFSAAKASDIKTMILLVEAGADPNIMSWGGDPKTNLWSYEVDQPYYEFKGYGPLHAICGAFASVPVRFDMARASIKPRKHDPEVFQSPDEPSNPKSIQRLMSLLLDRGVDVNAIDESGKTPLLYATNHRPVMVKFLLKSGADSSFTDGDRKNALHGCKDSEALKLLVGAGKININQASASFRLTPFLSAVSLETPPDVIRTLVSLGADVGSVDLDGKGAWHHLLHNSVSSNSSNKEEQLFSLIDVLLEVGVPLNIQDNKGKTALQAMPDTYHDFLPRIYSKLIGAGARSDIPDNCGKTILFHAVQMGNIDLVETLLQAGADPFVRDKRGRNLYFSCKYTDYWQNHNNTEMVNTCMVNLLKKLGVDPTIRDHDGILALPSARDKPDNYGRIQLHYESYDDKTPLTEELDAYENIDHKDNEGVRPLHIACKSSEQLVSKLLAAGASPTEPTHEGMTPLHIACRFRQTNVVGVLVEAIESNTSKEELSFYLNTSWKQVSTSSSDKYTAVPPILFLACASGVPETVSLLLASGANPNLWFGEYEAGSSLSWCLKYELEEKLWREPGSQQDIKVLDSNYFGVKMNDQRRTNYDGRERQRNGLADILDLIQEYGGDLMSMGKGERMPKLDYAITNWKFGDYALECLFSLRQRLLRESGNTAERSPCLDTDAYVEHLMETRKGIDASAKRFFEVRNESDFRPSFQMLSAVYRQAASRKAFKTAQPWDDPELLSILSANQQWNSVAYWALHDPKFFALRYKRTCNMSGIVSSGNLTLARKILSREKVRDMESMHKAVLDSPIRSYANASSVDVIKPLLLRACKRARGNMPMIRYLIEDLGVDINIQDVKLNGNYGTRECIKGTGALHIMASRATWWHSAHGLRYLLEHGADVNLKDHQGRTPILRAVSKLWKMPRSRSNLYRSLKLLTEYGADPNLTDSDGNSCLSYVADDKIATDILIKAGARVTIATVFDAITMNGYKSCSSPSLEVVESLAASIGVNTRMPQQEDGDLVQKEKRLVDDHEIYLLYVAAFRNPVINCSRQTKETDDEIRNRHIPLIKLLLKLGADPFVTFEMRPDIDMPTEEVTLLHCLLERGGFIEQILTLPDLNLEIRDQKGRTVLLSACRSAIGLDMSVDTLNPLFRDSWPSPFHQTGRPLNQFIPTGSPSIFNVLRAKASCLTARDNENKNALHHILEAKNGGGHEAIAALISCHPELVHQADNDAMTPIYYAFLRCDNLGVDPDVRSVEMLLDAGANPTFVDWYADSALHLLATSIGHIQDSGISPLDIFKRLLSLELPINSINDGGETPIFYFLKGQGSERTIRDIKREIERQTQALEALLGAGTDLFVTNNSGDTLLHIICWTSNPSRKVDVEELMVARFRWLLDKGLDPMAENDRQQTCLDIASANGHRAILSLFDQKT